MSATSSAPSLAQCFALILGNLRGLLAARMSRPQSVRQRDAWPLLMLLHTRLNRMAARFATLAARAAAGPPPRPNKPARTGQPPGTRDPLPRGVGWLIRLLPHEAACYGSQLQHLMSGPEMAALLEAAPQVGRILRPLCRMLAIPRPAQPPTAQPPAAPLPPPQAAPSGAVAETQVGPSPDRPDRPPRTAETAWAWTDSAYIPT